MENVDLDVLIGKSLDNRFELKKLIGQGGYGAVFEAVQTSMQRRCAVKILSFQTDDPKQVARFELEARVTCQLTHPNTIVVYEYGRDEVLGVFFIAMEYLDGQSLTELSNSRTLSIDEILHILGQIAESLDDAHSYNLVHRDIKPHNIMIVKRGTDELCVKVIDFGIAKTQEKGLDLTQTDTIIGTPEYMSTEQVLNKKLTGKSDQYALAVTAYYLLTGRTLFNCETALQIAVAHASEIPPAISTLTDRFLGAEKFDDSLLKALSKDPDSRFESCTEFVETLLKHKPGANPESAEYPIFSAGSKTPELSAASFEHAVAKTELAPVDPIVKESAELLQNEDLTAVGLSRVEEPKNSAKTFLILGVFAIIAIVGGFVFLESQKPNSKLADNITPKIEAEKPKEIVPSIIEKKSENIELPKPQIAPPEEKAVAEEKNKPIEDKKDPVPKIDKKKTTEKKQISKSVSETLDAIKNKKVKVKKEKKAVVKEKEQAVKSTVKIYTSPWGDIYVDGKKRSSKTRYTIKLSEGMHTFSLRQNGVSKSKKRLKVTAGESLRVRLSAD